ncbi:hypothetical protein [Lentzea sp.]|uniref:hypothetical protein n=1 Tax=Lentzea sp. TaxID=56099 RepID=UPI002CF16D96|nr:hypothetical protein [Lentzea sp.]HUQ56236.1 hypothetical protein [Lentzea sp.]
MKRIVVVCAALVLASCSARPESGGQEAASLSLSPRSARRHRQRPRGNDRADAWT